MSLPGPPSFPCVFPAHLGLSDLGQGHLPGLTSLAASVLRSVKVSSC